MENSGEGTRWNIHHQVWLSVGVAVGESSSATHLYVHFVLKVPELTMSMCSMGGFTFDKAVVVPVKAFFVRRFAWSLASLVACVLLGGCEAETEVLAPPRFALGSAVCKVGLRELLALLCSSCPRGLNKLPRSPKSVRLSPSANQHCNITNINIFYKKDFWTAAVWKFWKFHSHLGHSTLSCGMWWCWPLQKPLEAWEMTEHSHCCVLDCATMNFVVSAEHNQGPSVAQVLETLLAAAPAQLYTGMESLILELSV